MKTITAQFQGSEIHFHDDGWFNATEAAERYGKIPNDWLRLPATTAYLAAFERTYGKIPYVKTSKARTDRGGGTWLHPKLAVVFARWLDDDFAVWMDGVVDSILRGGEEKMDWKRLRHQAASSYLVMSTMLKEMREDVGKGTATFHYANEAKLVNFALCGEYAGLDRESLSLAELDLLAKLEVKNTILLARNVGRDDRREALLAVAANFPLLKGAA